MNFRCVRTVSKLVLLLSFAYISNAFAVVIQNGADALRSDIFVGESRQDIKAHQKRLKEQRNKSDQKKKAEAERKRLLEIKQRAIAKIEKADCPNKRIEIRDGDKVLETISKSNVESKKQEVEQEQQRLSNENGAGTNASTSQEGPAYNKHYASKLFQTYNGHITIEQKNIPKKIAITQGSTLQLDLVETPDAFWHMEMDENVVKIKTSSVNGNKRILILETVGRGSTRIILDNILAKANDYKVLVAKKMLIIVD